MVERYGNYEVDIQAGFVRLLVGSDNEYEYVVSEQHLGSKQAASKACRAFQIGFMASKDHTRRKLRDLIGQ